MSRQFFLARLTHSKWGKEQATFFQTREDYHIYLPSFFPSVFIFFFSICPWAHQLSESSYSINSRVFHVHRHEYLLFIRNFGQRVRGIEMIHTHTHMKKPELNKYDIREKKRTNKQKGKDNY